MERNKHAQKKKGKAFSYSANFMEKKFLEKKLRLKYIVYTFTQSTQYN